MAPEAAMWQVLDRLLACCRGGLQGPESGRRLEYVTCRLVAHVSAALARAGLRMGSILGFGPPFRPQRTIFGPLYAQYPSGRVVYIPEGDTTLMSIPLRGSFDHRWIN